MARPRDAAARGTACAQGERRFGANRVVARGRCLCMAVCSPRGLPGVGLLSQEVVR